MDSTLGQERLDVISVAAHTGLAALHGLGVLYHALEPEKESVNWFMIGYHAGSAGIDLWALYEHYQRVK